MIQFVCIIAFGEKKIYMMEIQFKQKRATNLSAEYCKHLIPTHFLLGLPNSNPARLS